MKPITLYFEAFGPFAKGFTINFDDFNHGLFLITGDTGSGKTMIFDALVFALYGQTSGSIRDVSTLRSQFANDDAVSTVRLTFMHHKKEYTIERTPTYERSKKRGEGTTTQVQTAVLTLPDGMQVSRVSEVNQTIETLLGIDYNQFKHVAMLAQGEFRELLMASSDERAIIFRKIFNTSLYEQLENKLKDEKRYLEESLKQMTLKLGYYEEDFKTYEVTVSDLTQFDAVISQLQKRFEDTSETLNGYKEKQAELRSKETALQQKYDDTLKRKTLLETEEVINQTLQKMLETQVEMETLKASIQRYEVVKMHIVPTFDRYRLVCDTIHKNELLHKQDLAFIASHSQLLKDETIKHEQLLGQSHHFEMRQKDLFHLEGLLPKFETLKALEIQLDTQIRERNQIEIEVKKTQDAEAVRLQAHQALLLELESISKLELGELALKQRYEQAKQTTHNARQLETLKASLIQGQSQLKGDQASYQEASKALKVIEDEYKHKYNHFLDMQAGILAQSLVSDAPCPVCGSTHHPHPALMEGEVVSQEALEVLELEVKSKREAVVALSEGILKQRASLEAIENQIQALGETLGLDVALAQEHALKQEYDEAQKTLHALQKRKQELEVFEEERETLTRTLELKTKQLQALQTQETTLLANQKTLKEELGAHTHESTNATIHAIKSEISQYQNTLKDTEASIRNTEIALKGATSRLETLQENLKEDAKLQASLEESLNALYRRYDVDANSVQEALEFEAVVDEKRVTVSQYEQEKQSLELEKKQIKKTLALLPMEDDETLLVELKGIKEALSSLEANMMAINAQVIRLQRIIPELLELSTSYQETIQRFEKISLLSDTASGLLRNRDKVSFERFVQGTYFTLVIDAANRRLSLMSDGRYVLYRKESANNRRMKAGLDLEVLDHYTGQHRDVSTLSGGESFKASLALALGLSDVIQYFSGGIEIDMLFVDEGFGSLDQESLDQAIETLIPLATSNRLVGIISHVSELKRRIDQKIVVHKHLDGSTISIEK